MQNIKEIKRKKIIYRAKYRGTKELDILIGAFIEKNINNDNMLDDLLNLLNCHDGDLQACLINNEAPPENIKNIFPTLQKFTKNYSLAK